MNPIRVGELCGRVGGKLLTANSELEVRSVCTDSRAIAAGCVFVALRGEKFDGHQFLEAAAGHGAAAAIVEREPRPPGLPPTSMQLILVENTRVALGRMAAAERKRFAGKVIAVAGSNGKTGTKLLIDAVLRGPEGGHGLRGSVSPRSFNNDVGVPLSILPADSRGDYLVLEIGTNHRGEILPLVRMAEPDIGVITNCSAEHLEGLGNVAGVRRENASMIDGMRTDGTLIVNGDDPELLRLVDRFPGKHVTFGLGEKNDLCVTNIRCGAEGTGFVVWGLGDGKVEAFVPLLGRHSALNAAAAMAVGREMGLAALQTVEHLKTARGAEMRLEMKEAGGVRVLNDAYNANPASMKAALETLAALPAEGRRVAVLGEMRELGAASETCHREVGRVVAANRPDWVVCVGPMAGWIADEARARGLEARKIVEFADTSAALAAAQDVQRGDLVLLKGSRAVGLETVARAILARAAGPAGAT